MKKSTDLGLFKIFEKIIKGELRPHLYNEDKILLLSELSGINVSYANSSDNIESKSEDIFDDPEFLDEIFEIPTKLPATPIEALYLVLIQIECIKIKRIIISFIEISDDLSIKDKFARDNIFYLKDLAVSLRNYKQLLSDINEDTPFLSHSYYVVDVLKRHLVYLIQYIEQSFSLFSTINIESYHKLDKELFHENITGPSYDEIYSLIPEENEFQRSNSEFNFKNAICERMPGENMGSYMFRNYKLSCENFSIEDRQIRYIQIITYLKELLLSYPLKIFSNGEVINEPEIEKVLIPLLENEIKFLENEKKNQTEAQFIKIQNLEKQEQNGLITLPTHGQKTEIYSETLQDKTADINKKECMIKKFIVDSVNVIDNNKQWEYVFRTETDYNTFLELLIKFLTNKPYTLPEEINLQKNCKTRFAPIFNTIYKKYKSTKLIEDEKYFEIIKIFSPFKMLSNSQIYKDITRF